VSLVERHDSDGNEDEEEHERHVWSVIVDASRSRREHWRPVSRGARGDVPHRSVFDGMNTHVL
jgi:hypothetical protein